MKPTLLLTLGGVMLATTALGSADGLLARYRAAGAGPFSATAGEALWLAEHRTTAGDGPRSCASCHGRDLRQGGRHAQTGKPIEPMAVSVNATRLSDPKKVEKWFLRNCKWTFGRECTPQEKGDFIDYMTNR